MADARALIVGAGPAGALLAYLLASRGVESVLVERQTDFEREFRGEVLMPSGLRALAAAGIGLGGVAHSDPRRVRLFFRRRCILDLAFDRQEDDELPRAVSQPQLLEHVVALAQATGKLRLVRGGTVRDLLLEDGRVAGVRVDTAHGSQELRADFVVGADGRASIVRRKLQPEVVQRGTPMDIVWCKLPWPRAWQPGQVCAHVGGGHLLIALQAPDRLLQLAWVILKGTYGELRARGVEEWVREMADHVDDELAGHLRASAGALSRPFLLDSVTDCVHGWARPGALLVGDAAHTMSPVGGQGLNLAMRDAVVAANHLVPALLGGGSLDAAAARVEAERRPEIDTIQRLAAQPPRVVMGRRFYHAWARSGVALLARTSLGQAAAARSVIGAFFDGTTRVELRV